MSYLHHVPGRVRIKSVCFRRPTCKIEELLEALQAREGVKAVSHNPRAASLTITYAPEKDQLEQLMALIGVYDCLPESGTRTVNNVREREKSSLGTTVGRVAAGVLLKRGVSYSLDSLIGVLR